MIYWELFLGFLQVGCFSFGGAYGAIPLIRDVVLSYGWLGQDALTYMIAISESTPGPIMVNLATFVGSTQAGFPGAVIATFAVVLPSFVVILLIMALLKTVWKHPWVQALLRGMKPCIIGIILATGIQLLLQNCAPSGRFDWKASFLTGLLALAFWGSRRFCRRKLSPIGLIILSALLGILAYGI